MEETIEFLKSNIPHFALPIYQEALHNYISKFEVLKQVPYSLQNLPQLNQIKLEQFLKILITLKINENDVFLFWIAKMYFLLEMDENWKFEVICGGSKVLKYKEQFITRLRPSIGYVIYLTFYYKKNKLEFEEMKKTVSQNQQNFYHIFQKDKNSEFKFYEIQTKLKDFKKINMKKIRQYFNYDLGSFMYFKQLDIQDEEQRQNENFSLFKDQQNYLKFKFKNIILKNHKTIQRDQIFKKNTLFKKTGNLYQNKFLVSKEGTMQNFIEQNEPKTKFLLKLSAQKKEIKLKSARSQIMEDNNLPQNLQRRSSQQKIYTQKIKLKKQKPKRLQVKKIIKQNQLQQFQQAKENLKISNLENQIENFYVQNNYRALQDIPISFQKKQNFIFKNENSKNIIQSKQLKLQLQTNQLDQKQSNIWKNFRSVGNIHFQDRVLSAQNLPQTGMKLHSFNLTTKKKKKKRK